MNRLFQLLAFVFSVASLAAAEKDPFAGWEPEIQAFEKADKIKMPPANAIVFAGSSSIRKWTNLTESFPKLQVIGRGFGGSTMADLLHFADRLITVYKPKTVLIYEGDNDLNAGKKPEVVVSEFKELATKLRHDLPDAKIWFISVKPSPSRWKIANLAQQVNTDIANYVKSDEHLGYIDVWNPMLGSDGKPRPDIFVADNLHMNGKGYEIWTRVITPKIQ